MTLPYPVLRAINMINAAGYEAYLVGGCVRDHLMEKKPFDWDIATSALPDQTKEVFADYRTIDTGILHGTITVLMDDLALEITTYRVDGDYSDGRHPDTVNFTPSLVEDLRRRDFTMNAIAYHPEQSFVDPFDGCADIQNGIIRCVGDPMKRFSEDALRIIRGIRFASTLGFAIEAQTETAIHRLAGTLGCVSVERITTEFKRLICGNFASKILEQFADVVGVFLPELTHIALSDEFDALPCTPRSRWAALFRQSGISPEIAQEALRRLKMDSKTIHEVGLLLADYDLPSTYTDAAILRLLNRLGSELIFNYFALSAAGKETVCRTQALLDNGACYTISALAVNGSDLLECGILPGPVIGQTLELLLDAVINGRCNNSKQELMDYLYQQKKPVQ